MTPCGKAPTVRFELQYAGFIIKFRTLSPEKLTKMSLKRPDLKCQIKRGIQFKNRKVHLETRPILHSKFHRNPLRSFCVILLKYQPTNGHVKTDLLCENWRRLPSRTRAEHVPQIAIVPSSSETFKIFHDGGNTFGSLVFPTHIVYSGGQLRHINNRLRILSLYFFLFVQERRNLWLIKQPGGRSALITKTESNTL